MLIAILEDSSADAEMLQEKMLSAGYRVQSFSNGDHLVQAIAHETFDVFLLDWEVPGKNGLKVLEYIRNIAGLTTPVVFITSRGHEHDIVAALNLGADDYCIKPVLPQVLTARIAALVRRSYPQHDNNNPGEVLGYTFYPAERAVHFDGNRVLLSDKEFALALFFFTNSERALSRSRLMQEAWGKEGDALSRSLDVYVSSIRKKLHLSASSALLRLRPIYGYGYRLVVLRNEGGDE